MKMDAKFYGVIYKAKDGTRVPEDEYVVFLVKDTAFFDTLPMYLANCIRLGADKEQVEAVLAMISRARVWREANKHRLKVPDAAGEMLLNTE